MILGLNIDPRNPQGDPTADKLHALGVDAVRFTYKDFSTGSRPKRAVARFYRQKVAALAQAQIGVLVVLTAESFPAQPASEAEPSAWDRFIQRFAGRAAKLAEALAPGRPAFQIWNAPDLTEQPDNSNSTLSPAVYGRLLNETCQAIKTVDPEIKVISAGLVSGQPDWLASVAQSVEGRFPADAIALHPYTRRPTPDWPDPNWGTGYVGDLIKAYRAVTNLPIWITEIGIDSLSDQAQAEYLRRFYGTMTADFSDGVERVYWFCYAEGMAYGYGLIDQTGEAKPAHQAYRELATAPLEIFSLAATATVSLERLHSFAQYLEQNIVFGYDNPDWQRQLETELRGNTQQLTKVEIWRIAQQLLAGSNYALAQTEVEALYALRTKKDLLGLLRSIVLTVHQRTGALSGRLGPHVRIAAETDANAETNIAALLQAVAHVQPGNRMLIMDTVKATADEGKLRAPDVFETNVYGQHRNGLVDNHAWNLQRLIRAIRDRGYQNRVMLIIRLDGPDSGANVNVFDPNSLVKYELAIAKLIRYLETVLPTVPFKIALGNEPDLPKERQWSSPDVEPRTYTLDTFAPATGAFMKKMARLRPDVTFICPALSGNLKYEYLAYYRAFFGADRPANLVPGMHGYAADVATLPAGQKNLLEQQAEALRLWGKFRRISGTEIGSGNPLGDIESLSDKGYFEDGVAWLLLSTEHRTPPGQDNNWKFVIDPRANDPTARYLADIVNRTQNRVLRNIREWDGAGLQILRGHGEPRSAYDADYIEHNTPPTMIAGQTNAVQFTLRNSSYRTWPAGGPNPVRLGYHWYTSSGQEVPATLWDDHRTQLPYDVLPGDQVTLNCNLGAPRQPGSYELRWDLVEEMRTWFAWQGVETLNIAVTVKPEVPTPTPPQLTVSASHNNRLDGPDNLRQAIDANPYTRWSSRQPQQPGMWFQIDLSQTQTVSQIRLVQDSSPRDYPRGYVVRVSTDGQAWQTVAEVPQNQQPLDVIFSPRPVRLIRIEQTGSDSIYWWSIHAVEISSEIKISAQSSHNNVLTGADNVAQAVDGQPDTRWSSRALQQPGMWFELDLKQLRNIKGLKLDTAGSPNDYPRGYIVRLSPDGQQWREVARQDNSDRALDLNFAAQPARYIRVEQTASADRWWWSIHEVAVRYDDSRLVITATASHNNVLSGVDNLTQALDDQPDTRWSSRALQQPGMWFELDLNSIQTVKGLQLDTAASWQDYPRGYIVSISLDRQQWTEVARKNNNDRALDVNFEPRTARYIRVAQTGQSDQWWWSIHRVEVRT